MANDPNAPIVIGNLRGRLTPNAGAELTISLYGMDTLTRPITCVTGDLWKFTPKKYAPDPEYPKMYFIEARVRYVEGLLTTADLIYSGKARGLPDPEISDYFLTKSATKPIYYTFWVLNPGSGGFDSKDDQVTINIQYRAPSTNYAWITDRKPGAKPPALFRKVRSSASPFDPSQVVRISLQHEKGTLVLPDKFVDNYFAVEKVIESIEQYQIKELIPGRYWECSATVSRVIDPILTEIRIITDEPS